MSESFTTPSHLDAISTGAFDLASRLLPPAILNHSSRVAHYAHLLATQKNSPWAQPLKQHLLFTACILHDIGCTSHFDGPQRFEVEGADAAATHLRKFGVEEADVKEVWMAIALHTSPGIAERISDLACLVRQAVLIDFGKHQLLDPVLQGDEKKAKAVSKVESEYSRLDVEKVLGDCVVGQAKKRPEKAPSASWPGLLYRSFLADPEFEGVNRAFRG